jgi:hypothetical protein
MAEEETETSRSNRPGKRTQTVDLQIQLESRTPLLSSSLRKALPHNIQNQTPRKPPKNRKHPRTSTNRQIPRRNRFQRTFHHPSGELVSRRRGILTRIRHVNDIVHEPPIQRVLHEREPIQAIARHVRLDAPRSDVQYVDPERLGFHIEAFAEAAQCGL